ncbi:glycosyltransferase family 61 protein [Methylobacterium sp. 77]|uniref:glycosyltransferase family 61 protein n=1 Tax=Methylobacterium sp. 77 TaxID=1101192 RepID=UPI0003AB0FA8|nr:glycosyltransferase family 61 protein [Methylobacterium sp. 77]
MAKVGEPLFATLSDARRAVSSGSWQQILDWGKDDAFLLQSHHIVNAYVAAAYELSQVDALQRAADLALSPRWDRNHRYSFARAFVASERCDLAWRTIQANPDIYSDPAFVKQARRVIAYSHDEVLRDEIKRAIVVAMKGGSEIKPTPSSLHFAFESSPAVALGSAVAKLSSRTSPRHLAAFDLAIQRTRDALLKAKRPVLREYSNVFVDRHGQIWREDGSIIKTTGKPIVNIGRNEVSNHHAAVFGIKETRGIYHWLVDRLASFAWMLQEDIGKMPILLSDKASHFEATTLSLVSLGDLVCSVGGPEYVERLIVPRVGFEGMMYWDQVSPIFQNIRNYALDMAVKAALSPAEKIYISRSDAKRRPMSNEKEIEVRLAAEGYQIISFTGMPLWQQFFIAFSAKEIVAPHGAGLSHLIMCASGTKVTEILPISDGTHKLRFNYARLSLLRGHQYSAWLEPQIGEEDSWSVDVDPFLEFLHTQ